MKEKKTSSSILPIKKAALKLAEYAELACVLKVEEALGADADLHLVGGTVRDIFCGAGEIDLDLATKLRPKEAVSRLTAAGIRVVETGVERGTVLVPGTRKIEITTFREASGRNETRFSDSITEDLAGRDFTINAMAFSIAEKEVIDPCKGLEDLEAGLLRCVGKAWERFEEDPLRILRMLRFGPGSGRKIDPATAEAAKKLKKQISSVSVERIRDEIEHLILSPFPAEAFRAARDLDLLDAFLPELCPMVGFEQNRFHDEDVYSHTLTVMSRAQKDRHVLLAALFHDTGKPHTLSVDEDGNRHFYQHEQVSEETARTVMERLHFSREDIHAVSLLVAEHMRSLDCGPPGARRIMRDTGELYDKWRELKKADTPPCETDEVFCSRLRRFDELVESERIRLQGDGVDQLVINGDDLIAIGFEEGRRLGEVLSSLRDEIVEDPAKNTREFLLFRAGELYSDKASD